MSQICSSANPLLALTTVRIY